MVQEAVEDCRSCGDIAQQLAPVFQRPVGSHHRAPRFVAAHHDLKEKLTATFGQLLHPKVINDQQVRLEVTRHHSVVAVHRFVMKQVTNHIKDASVVNVVTLLDQLVTDPLDDVALASSRRSRTGRLDAVQ